MMRLSLFVFTLINVIDSKFLGQSSLLRRSVKQVHLMPHSHDDVGWLNTVDEIYEGHQGVKHIITSYVNALDKDPSKKFVQVEILYFQRWWNEQNEQMKLKVRKLINGGQLDFACGGLTMNDEATPYYEDIIDQLTAGHKFLYEEFKVRPRVGWYIDNFGHSATQAMISQAMGFDSQFFARIDRFDKEKRLKLKGMEMVVIPTNRSPQAIFTHVNYEHYSSPKGFDFDVLRSSQLINEQNLESRSRQLVAYFNEQFKHYQGNIIAHTLGDDNEWSNADRYFENLDKLIKYINDNSDEFGMELLYSTPNTYIREIAEQNLTYPVKRDDFYPYSDQPHSYWTGYFTSRVAFKGMVRNAGRYYQIVKHFISKQLAIGQLELSKISEPLQEMSEAMGICQHHDAVTGTAKQRVTYDYQYILSQAIYTLDIQLKQIIKSLAKQELNVDVDIIYRCNNNGTSTQCQGIYKQLSDSKSVLIMFMDSNLINSSHSQGVRVKVPQLPLLVLDQLNSTVKGDIICSNKTDETDCTLYFIRQPTYDSMLQYYLLQVTTPDKSSTLVVRNIYTEQNQINYKDDSVIKIGNAKPFRLQYQYYLGKQDYMQPSGAYIFRPDGQKLSYGAVEEVLRFEGTVVTELIIRRTYTQTWIRQWSNKIEQYEIDTFIDSIPIDDQKGKEIVMVIDTDIVNDKVFYTDSNGLDLQKRTLNHRNTWDFVSDEPITENYYPINIMIALYDTKSNQAVAVVNDRSQGGTSLKDGQIEIMIHRRLLRDDKRGVGESLNEQEAAINTNVRGPQGQLKNIGLQQLVQHHLIFYDRQTQPNAARLIQFEQDSAAIQYYADTDMKTIQFSNLNIQSNPFKIVIVDQNNQQIVDNVKINIQPWNDSNVYLVRINNLNEVGYVTVNWPNGSEVVQMTLNGNQEWVEWLHKWHTNEQYEQPLELENRVLPQQIKAFIYKLQIV